MPKLKGSLALHVVMNDIIDKLISFIKTLPKYEELKNDMELILNLAKQVDKLLLEDKTLRKKQKEQVSKTELILEALTKAFDLKTDAEIQQVKQNLEFFINNKLIKKNSFSKIVSKVLSKLV